MSRKIKDIVIGGVKYEVTQFKIKQSLSILQKIMRYIGPVMSDVMDGFDPSKKMLEQDMADLNIGKAISHLVLSLEEDELYNLFKVLFRTTISSKTDDTSEDVIVFGVLKDDTFDTHFNDDEALTRMVGLAKFVITENYSGFLKGLSVLKTLG